MLKFFLFIFIFFYCFNITETNKTKTSKGSVSTKPTQNSIFQIDAKVALNILAKNLPETHFSGIQFSVYLSKYLVGLQYYVCF